MAKMFADQFTSNLLRVRGSFSAGLASVLATVQPDQRIAVGQQYVEDARKRRHDFVRALEVVAGKRERGESVAVGDANTCCPPGVNVQPNCTIDGRRLCDYDRIGARTLTTAGNAVFTLSPQPAAGNMAWRPKMVRGWAHLTANPSVPAWEGLFITTITIGTAPVEGFNTAAAAGVTDGIAFGDYVVPDTNAVPVGWPNFTTTALSRPLVISGIGLWPVASAFIAYMTVLGNAINMKGIECRVNPDSATLPNVPTTTNGGAPNAGGWRPA